LYSTHVINITEYHGGVTVSYVQDKVEKTISGRIVVGADGINSFCRQFISCDTKRDSGEVVYRGMCNLGDPQLRNIFMESEKECPGSMSIYYGHEIRASWGLINEKATRGFWWIKVSADKVGEQDNWPHPLKTLCQSTSQDQLYIHPVVDRLPINKWCTERIVLIGDAAHPVTPNMAQGIDDFWLHLHNNRCKYGY
jgi:2-polyprenyl-6-methoxyphenol hydroxylase-like FAD-dependent oxidoreductase